MRIVKFVVLLVFLGLQSNSSAYASDIEGPKLKSWKILGSNKADISTENAIFIVEITVTDESHISSVNCFFNSKTSSQSSIASGEFISSVNNISTFRLKVEIRVRQATGQWEFGSCGARDSLGNSSGLDASALGETKVFVYDAESIAEDKAQEIENQEKEKIYNENQDKIKADEAARANRKSQSILVTPNIKGSIQLKVKSIAIKASANSKLPLSVRTSTPDTCLYSNGKIQIKSIGRCVVAFSQDGNNEFKRAESKVLAFKIVKK